MKRLLSGNEAIALGAWQAGVRYAAAYPGTPSTEILPALAQYAGVTAEWAANEKAALDSAIGASFAGARSLAAMKHVGVNVASDSLMTLSYTGVGAGLVLISADDPGAFSSQNEQDNRHYALFGKFPVIEPSDSQEATEFTLTAFQLSEQFDTPVMIRSTTRLSHSKSAVTVDMPSSPGPNQHLPPFSRKPQKYVMIPAHARLRHPQIESRLKALAAHAESAQLNRVEWGDRRIGVVTAGIAYQYAREVFGDFSFLKLGMSYPLPPELIRGFASEVETLVVVEELDPFVEQQIRALGLEAVGKAVFPATGELTIGRVRQSALAAGLPVSSPGPVLAGRAEAVSEAPPALEIPQRPPALCPGCPHRSVFFALRSLKALVAGDIGCYAIGVLPPFEEMDMLISMGASIGLAHGAKKAGCPDPLVATIGDSTFFHSGLSELASAVYNRSTACTVILDNGTTAMTGGQDNPATGTTLQGEVSTPIRIENIVRAMGVDHVRTVDALAVDAVSRAIKEAIEVDDQPSVVIVEGACVFTTGFERRPVVTVDARQCNGCGFCFRVGCPAILKSPETDERTGRQKATIDNLLCTGCTVCLQVCPRQAIRQTRQEA